MKVVSIVIFNILSFKENLILALDKTNWKFGEHDINILMLGVSYKNVAFALMFRMLDKRGNSDTEKRISLIKKYSNWFGKQGIDCLLADRVVELHGQRCYLSGTKTIDRDGKMEF